MKRPEKYIILHRGYTFLGGWSAWYFAKTYPECLAEVFPSALDKIKQNAIFSSLTAADAFLKAHCPEPSNTYEIKIVKYFGPCMPIFDNPLFFKTFSAGRTKRHL